jgi:hypothetical protein
MPALDDKNHYSIPSTNWSKHQDFESNIRDRFEIVSKFVDESLENMKGFQPFQKGSISSNAVKWILKEISMLIMFESSFASTKYITELKCAYVKKTSTCNIKNQTRKRQ